LNKRDKILGLKENKVTLDYIPAAFFMHFDKEYFSGQAAINKHLEFYEYTQMDFVKIQYEQKQPLRSDIKSPRDWVKFQIHPDEFFEPTLFIVNELVKACKSEALVIMTLYSPFMLIRQVLEELEQHYPLDEYKDEVKKGMEIMTENVIKLARGCIKLGVDGFLASTQGGEAYRYGNRDFFWDCIKPSDLAVWEEIKACEFNILHVCDLHGLYDELTPFLDYPGDYINCGLNLSNRELTPREISSMFGRPFIGGLDRHGVIYSGSLEEIKKSANEIIEDAPDQFILGSDCTMIDKTPWDNLRAAVEAAHNYKK